MENTNEAIKIITDRIKLEEETLANCHTTKAYYNAEYIKYLEKYIPDCEKRLNDLKMALIKISQYGCCPFCSLPIT